MQSGICDFRTVKVRACGAELADSIVSVDVDDYAGETVGFRIDETERVGKSSECRFAQFECFLEAAVEECLVDGFIFLKRPDACGETRFRGERREREKMVFGVPDYDIGALDRLAVDFGDGSREDPRVAAQQGFFASFFKYEFKRYFLQLPVLSYRLRKLSSAAGTHFRF